MAKKRTKHSATTKARVAVEALRERKTVAEIGSQYRVAPTFRLPVACSMLVVTMRSARRNVLLE